MLFMYKHMNFIYTYVCVLTEQKANMERERRQKSSNTHQPWYLCNVSSMLLQLKLVCYLFPNVVDAMVKKILIYKYIFSSLPFYLIIMLIVRFLQCNSRIPVIYFFFFSFHLAMFWQKERDTTPGKMFSLCSLSYLGAMLASNHALQHVSYPTQVIQTYHRND